MTNTIKVVRRLPIRHGGLIFVCLLCFFAGAMKAPAARYVVEPGTPGGTNAGNFDAWSIAATQIQWAVDVALTGDNVWVSNGTYYLTNQISIAKVITLRGVNGATNTIINGNYPNYTNRCLYITTNAVVDGFTITNACYTNDGGGVSMQLGTVQNCVISGNRIISQTNVGYGGGIYFTSGIVSNCQIIGNSVTNPVAAGGSSITIGGGGVTLTGGLLTDCLVYTNQVGGIYNANYSAHGGGITMSGGTVLRCVIKDNVSWSEAGAMYMAGGTMSNSTIRGNFSPKSAAIYMSGSSQIYNCLIVSNRVVGAEPSGLKVYGGSVHNCTVVGNLGSTYYGGILLYFTMAENTISYYNTARDWYLLSGNERLTNCCGSSVATGFVTAVVSITNCGPNNITNEPLFVDTNASNYRLSFYSPCVNAGTNQGWMTGAFDLDGRTRLRYGSVDMGAYERIYEGTFYRFH